MRYTFIVLGLVWLAGCSTPEQAALNARNADLGAALAANENPPVAEAGAEIAANAGKLEVTTFESYPRSEITGIIPTSPELAAKLREKVQQDADAETGFFAGLKGLAGMIPYGAESWALIATTLGLAGTWWRNRKVRTALHATVTGIEAARKGGLGAAITALVNDPALRDMVIEAVDGALKGSLSKAHDDAGARDLVDSVLEKVAPKG